MTTTPQQSAIPSQPPDTFEQVLAAASPEAVEKAAARLPRYFPYRRWLGDNNRYLRRAVEMVKADAAQPQDADSKHLSEYVAVSAVLHAADGWAYLGRALGAACRGDIFIARHLAYYAELRAALGLLATQGVALFNGRHVVITPTHVGFFRGPSAAGGGTGTHVVTWRALEWWADQPAATALLSNLVCPGGTPLASWVNGLGIGGSAWNPIGSGWLKAWGLDLRTFGGDRDKRNAASYRPTTLRDLAREPVADARFIRDFWPLLEPSSHDPYRELDRHLLRLTLEHAFRAITGRDAIGNADFHRALDRTLHANPPGGLGSSIVQFLRRGTEPQTPELLEASAARGTHLDPRYHAQVMGRATLLLRVASGAATELLGRAGLNGSDYRFWLEGFAESHGLCDTAGFPADPADLWADVRDALEDLEVAVAAGADRSFFQLLERAAAALGVLSGCERVAAWGLAA